MKRLRWCAVTTLATTSILVACGATDPSMDNPGPALGKADNPGGAAALSYGDTVQEETSDSSCGIQADGQLQTEVTAKGLAITVPRITRNCADRLQLVPTLSGSELTLDIVNTSQNSARCSCVYSLSAVICGGLPAGSYSLQLRDTDGSTIATSTADVAADLTGTCASGPDMATIKKLFTETAHAQCSELTVGYGSPYQLGPLQYYRVDSDGDDVSISNALWLLGLDRHKVTYKLKDADASVVTANHEAFRWDYQSALGGLSLGERQTIGHFFLFYGDETYDGLKQVQAAVFHMDPRMTGEPLSGPVECERVEAFPHGSIAPGACYWLDARTTTQVYCF